MTPMPEPKSHMFLRSELRALFSAIALTAAGCQPSAEYAAGFSAALTAMAVGLGLEEMPAQQTQTFTIEKPQWVRLGVVR